MIRWARGQRRRVGVRLVKGAYWDSEIAWAKQKSWPIPVFLDKAATDANYERLSRMLLEGHDVIDAAFGSHNLRSLAHAIVAAKEIGVPVNGYEMQMLYGMAEPVRQAIIQNGQRVRVYLPVGELLPGISYLIRRLMENTSNTSFLRQTYAEKKAVDSLIKAPAPAIAPDQADDQARDRQRFHNEALIDFSQVENRQRFAATLQEVRGEWQKQRRRSSGGSWLESVNPADPNEVVGRVRPATIAETEKAIDKAARFFPQWRATPAAERAEILFKAAEIMRQRRWQLAATELFEVGKGWREADADVCEAIDYLDYYAHEMLRLAPARETQQLPSETNTYFYEPRGLAAVIAPWNFPLAILTGMTAAALVTGNCVLMKPAEQAPIMGAQLLDILQSAGLPDGACQLLQGGGDIGAHLVRSPKIHLIAFTGSRQVGLEILREAYTHRPGQTHVKRVVCEMGGKNAVIVDNDADLDEAVVHVIDSAFGYQGQKCSAASRVILLSEVHDRFLRRLVDAVGSLKIGPPEDPAQRHRPGDRCGSAQANRRIYSDRQAGSQVRARNGCASGRIFYRADDFSRRRSEEPAGAGRNLRAGVVGAQSQGLRSRLGDRQRFGIRPDRRHLFALAGAYRTSAQGFSRRQSLHQSRHHRRRCRTPAVRRFETVRHRLQGGRAGLSLTVCRTADGLGKHFAPRFRAAEREEKNELSRKVQNVQAVIEMRLRNRDSQQIPGEYLRRGFVV